MKRFLPFLSFLVSLSSFAVDIELSAENNVATRIITLGEGDRLVVPTPEAAGGLFEIVARVQPSGSAELVLSEGDAPAYDAVVLSGDLWAVNGGSLRVTGGSLLFGRPLSMTDIDYPRFDCPLSFDEGNELVLTNASTIHMLPSTAVSIAPGALLAVRGTNTLERFMDPGETPSFTATTNYTVQVHADSVFPSGTRVTVKPGAVLGLKPCRDKVDGTDWENGWKWAGCIAAFTHISEIVLESNESARACVHDLSRKKLEFQGMISGTGDFRKDQLPIAYEDRTYLQGRCTFKGTVTVKGLNTALYFCQSSPGDRENAVVCEGAVRLGFQSTETVYIRSLSSTNPEAKLWIQGNQTVEIAESRGPWQPNAPAAGQRMLRVDNLIDGHLSVAASVPLALVNCGETAGVSFRSYAEVTAATLDLTDYAGVWPLMVNIEKCCTLAVKGGAGGTLRVAGAGELTDADGLTVLPAESSFVINTVSNAVLTVDASALATNWQKKVAAWFDASAAETLIAYPENTCYTNGYPLIRGWTDCRKGARAFHFYNGRSLNTTGGFRANSDRHDEVYPFVVTGGLNGRDYVSMGSYQKPIKDYYGIPSRPGTGTVTEARRLTMVFGSEYALNVVDATTNCPTAYAILVFGSQQGGGAALLGAGGSLARDTGAAEPFFRNTAPSMYVDGSAVNGGTATPNGGWQILSIPLNGAKVNAIGWNSAFNNSGGQNYAEILLFSNAPTDLERRQCEDYLARKWGLTKSYASAGTPAPMVGLYGGGSVALSSDAAVSGGFAGTVTVAGNATLVLSPGPPPPDESVVPSANRLVWFDPDLADALNCSTASRSLCVSGLYPRDENGVCSRTTAMSGLAGSFDRRPWANRSARGLAGERTWLDFMNLYPGDTSGNTLRYQTNYTSSSTDFTAFGAVREGFMVLDTSRGGGTPIGYCVSMAGTRRPHLGTNGLDAVWATASGIYASMTTRLDNVVLNGTAVGFNGRPEVLEFSCGAAWNPAFFGSYQDGDGDNSGKGNAEVIGESIFYSQPLSDAQRAEVTAYLAYKWFGKVMRGYGDLTRMTVTGAGRVEVPDFVALPHFADGFTGMLACSARVHAFTLDPAVNRTHALDAVTLPAPFELTVGSTIAVTCMTALRTGVYALLDGTVTCPDGTLPELVFTGENPDGYDLGLVRTDASLALRVGSSGLQIIIR